MRVEIDRSICTGHGRCYSLAPDVFEYDAEGFGVPIAGDVPDALEGQARRGAAGCPERAVNVDDGRR